MFIIASNLTTRDSNIEYVMRQAQAAHWSPDGAASESLKDVVKRCAAAGPDMIEVNVQQHHDVPEAMEYAVRTVQQATDRPLCLSANSVMTLESGLRACNQPPLLNHLSIDQVKLENLLPLAAKHKAGIVLLVSEPSAPADAREMLQKAAILVGAAVDGGIPAENIYVDPGLIHVTSEAGQRHLAQVLEFLRNFREAIEPPVKTTCWLSNSSAGSAPRLRAVIETSLLPLLAGLGLSSVFIDVLSRENVRALRLMQVFEDRRVYSDGELEL
jgi:cobalamin-dependent methionine synthase I